MADRRFIFAPETGGYGVLPSTGWRRIEVAQDGHKTRRDPLQYRGIGAAGGAPSLSGRRLIDKGGEGPVNVPGFANGLGMFFRAAASTAASAVVVDGTDAFQQTFTFGTDGAPAGRTVASVAYRDRLDGTLDSFAYTGGKPTQIEIGQDLEAHLMFTFTMDYLRGIREDPTPARTPVVVDPDFIYAWPDALITLTPLGGGAANTECLRSFAATHPLALDVEDWCLKKGTSRHEPTRSGLPEPTGTLNWKYHHPRYYDAFLDGAAFSLTALWEAEDPIEDTTVPSLQIDYPAIVFTGEDPELAVDGPTMQNLPFAVQSNGTDPACTITVVTSDTTF